MMDEATLEAYIKQYIEGQNTPEIVFSWQGGEQRCWVWITSRKLSSFKRSTSRRREDLKRSANKRHVIE